MEDLTNKLNAILSDPESMKELGELASMFSANAGSIHNDAPAKPAPAIEPTPPVPDEMLSMVTRLMPLMSSVNTEDDTDRLLNALRPFLKEERQKKLDSARKLLKIMRLMPLMKEFDLFDL